MNFLVKQGKGVLTHNLGHGIVTNDLRAEEGGQLNPKKMTLSPENILMASIQD